MQAQRTVSAGLRLWLTRHGFASEEDIRKVVSSPAHSGESLLAAIAKLSGKDEADLLAKLAGDLGLELVTLGDQASMAKLRQSGLVGRFASEFLLRHRLLPIAESDEQLHVAIADPLDRDAVSEVEFRCGKRVLLKLARENQIVETASRLLGLHQAELIEAPEGLADFAPKGAEELLVGDVSGLDSEEAGSGSAPIIRLVNQVLADAQRSSTSDVHLEPSKDSMEIRFRVDGVMKTHLTVPKRLQPYIVARLKLLAGMDITEKRRPQDGRFRIRLGEGGGTDIRVSSVPASQGEKLVLRLLSGGGDYADLGSLDMEDSLLQQLREVLRARDRIILVTGPTGSGKTTTLYAAVAELRSAVGNLVTVEDPIERRIEGITQIQIDTKIGVTFAGSLRSILRQDPDVILVGEIRDAETAQIAFQAAQTGHLVLSTLHTNTAAAAVVRLRDLGMEPFLLASSLGGVLAQRLVRRVCLACAVPLTEDQKADLERKVGPINGTPLRGAGCDECGKSGLRGRIGVYSLLTVDGPVSEIIRKCGSESEIERTASMHGMHSLTEAALELIARGLTTLDEVERVLGRLSAPHGSVSRPLASYHPAGPAAQVDDDSLFNSIIKPRTDAAGPQGKPDSIFALAEKARKDAASILKKKVIVLIDDDEGVRAVMGHILRKSDFEVIEAENGYEGMDKVLEHQPDVIVCDLVMPGMSGLELLEQLKKNPASERIPFMMLTGSDSEDNEVALIDAGARDFMSKASSPKLVVSRIKRIIEG